MNTVLMNILTIEIPFSTVGIYTERIDIVGVLQAFIGNFILDHRTSWGGITTKKGIQKIRVSQAKKPQCIQFRSIQK